MLLVQIDKFQKQSYLVLSIYFICPVYVSFSYHMIIPYSIDMMRAISSVISAWAFNTYKFLLVPVPTGTAMLELENVDKLIGASAYHSGLIPVEHLLRSKAHRLMQSRTKITLTDGNITNPLVLRLNDVCGGVALWHAALGNLMLSRSDVTTLEKAADLWKRLVDAAGIQYLLFACEYLFIHFKFDYKDILDLCGLTHLTMRNT